jgi:hypothetical protein
MSRYFKERTVENPEIGTAIVGKNLIYDARYPNPWNLVSQDPRGPIIERQLGKRLSKVRRMWVFHNGRTLYIEWKGGRK